MVILSYPEIISWVVANMAQECEGVRRSIKSAISHCQALVLAILSDKLDNFGY